jgi:predicted nucleic acid-binding protein
MTQHYLLDTNLIVAVFDEHATTSVEQKAAAAALLENLLANDEVALSISPLIRYEVLRGIHWQDSARLARLLDVLNRFEEFDIGKDVSMLAADLYRFSAFQDQQAERSRSLDKRKFDVFHFATAQVNQLSLASADSDVAKIQQLHETYLDAEFACKLTK